MSTQPHQTATAKNRRESEHSPGRSSSARGEAADEVVAEEREAASLRSGSCHTTGISGNEDGGRGGGEVGVGWGDGLLVPGL